MFLPTPVSEAHSFEPRLNLSLETANGTWSDWDATALGTTVRDPNRLPEHLAADEHHADWCGEKGYVAFTAGEGCILGLALTPSADEDASERGLRPVRPGSAGREARLCPPDREHRRLVSHAQRLP